MITRTAYDLDQFVADMTALLGTQPDQSDLFNRAASYLEKLIGNPTAIPEQFRRPVGTGKRANHGSYALYRGEGLFVSAVVWGPGDRVGPHDHQTWGLIGVMDNAIQETRYRRMDDRDKDGFAVLEQDRSVLVKPGDVSLLVPDIDEIHRMDNDSDRATVEIHVYGKDLVDLPRHRYDLATNRVIPFASERFDNC
ncbi:MAG: cysteine dioxygenase family protein [Chloroflexi bacterium]|nr:cysteine dioxygenase family protein [Chloroflexota bacterium]MBV9897019.1 cysteine dioxygenase family protein [Chloroflexota bacterium]